MENLRHRVQTQQKTSDTSGGYPVVGSHAPHPDQTKLNIKRTKPQVRIVEPAGKAIRASLVAACTQMSAIVLPAQVGFLKVSFAVDTSASVNVLSEESYLALKSASRGGRWPLKPSTTK